MNVVIIKGSIALNTRNIYYTDSAKTKTQYGLKITVESSVEYLSKLFAFTIADLSSLKLTE